MFGRGARSRTGWQCRPGGHYLTTEHLVLRAHKRRDLAALIASVDSEVAYWQGFPAADRAQLSRFLTPRHLGALRPPPGHEYWVVCDRATGAVIGARSVVPSREPRDECSTGSWLAGGWRGKGLGTEELRAVLALAQCHLGYSTVVAGTAATNVAALRQYEKCGFESYERKPHRLPDGRVVDSVWLRRTAPSSAHCPRHG